MNEQVLQVLVLGELRALEDNALKQTDQFSRQFRGQRGLSGRADFIGVGGGGDN